MTTGRGVTTAWAVSALELFQAAPWAWSPGVGLTWVRQPASGCLTLSQVGGARKGAQKEAASALPTHSHPWHPQTSGSAAWGVGICPREPSALTCLWPVLRVLTSSLKFPGSW